MKEQIVRDGLTCTPSCFPRSDPHSGLGWVKKVDISCSPEVLIVRVVQFKEMMEEWMAEREGLLLQAEQTQAYCSSLAFQVWFDLPFS